jgi:DNA-binding CsgD family transcriptional regulator
LRLVGSGKQLAEIAEILSLAPKTISFYRMMILEKLKLRNNNELTFYATQNGFTDMT